MTTEVVNIQVQNVPTKNPQTGSWVFTRALLLELFNSEYTMDEISKWVKATYGIFLAPSVLSHNWHRMGLNPRNRSKGTRPKAITFDLDFEV